MTPGTNLDRHNDTGVSGDTVVDDACLQAVAQAVVTALRLCWARGISHGDLNIANILFSHVDRTLSLVDVGVPADHGCEPNDRSKGPGVGPAAEDLGYLFFDAASQIRGGWAAGSRYQLRRDFARHAANAALADCATPQEKARLLQEIAACTQWHLDLLALPLSSPRGIWCRVVRSLARRRIATLIAGIDLTPAVVLRDT